MTLRYLSTGEILWIQFHAAGIGSLALAHRLGISIDSLIDAAAGHGVSPVVLALIQDSMHPEELSNAA